MGRAGVSDKEKALLLLSSDSSSAIISLFITGWQFPVPSSRSPHLAEKPRTLYTCLGEKKQESYWLRRRRRGSCGGLRCSGWRPGELTCQSSRGAGCAGRASGRSGCDRPAQTCVGSTAPAGREARGSQTMAGRCGSRCGRFVPVSDALPVCCPWVGDAGP